MCSRTCWPFGGGGGLQSQEAVVTLSVCAISVCAFVLRLGPALFGTCLRFACRFGL